MTKKTTPTRFDCYILGKVVGKFDGWENLGDDEGDVNDVMIFSALKRNLLGKKAFPDFTDGHDLVIEFFTGVATMFDPTNEDYKPFDLTVNWGAFAN